VAGFTRREMLAVAAAASAAKSAFAQPRELARLTIRQASDLLRSKSASPVELTRACLDRIQAYNSKLNAFITVTG